jgi:hypothetical protein
MAQIVEPNTQDSLNSDSSTAKKPNKTRQERIRISIMVSHVTLWLEKTKIKPLLKKIAGFEFRNQQDSTYINFDDLIKISSLLEHF